ncbi:MAG: ABC transporter ATP-binding protein [Bifidobacteriaceae bacterium]|jgi:peptide/nickel transport system ATP-binding protein|nr:ABC transporter ATP-binding protein [Bifidobacteriaceae bacterium]
MTVATVADPAALTTVPVAPAGPPKLTHGGGQREPVLRVRGLYIEFFGRGRYVHAVRGLDLTVHPGEAVALVGESGSGKSVTALSLLGLTGPTSQVKAAELTIAGRDARGLSDRGWRQLRGAELGLVLQDALTSLDPLRTVGQEIKEALSAHGTPKGDLQARVEALLAEVGFPDPAARSHQYAHQLSGGLRQRALIASALAGDPKLIVADEPTTALDVTVQAQILDLLAARRDAGTALVLISHDLAVVSRVASRVLVMREGIVVEEGPTDQILGAPRHDYTKALLRAVPSAATRGHRLSTQESKWLFENPVPSEDVPGVVARKAEGLPLGGAQGLRLTTPRGAAISPGSPRRSGAPRRTSWGGAGAPQPVLGSQTVAKIASPKAAAAANPAASGTVPVLRAADVSKTFTLAGHRRLRAVVDVDVTVERGQKVGIVGESGSGKSTLARILLGLVAPDTGTVEVQAQSWLTADKGERGRLRRAVQFVSQDSLGSFDPRYTVAEIVAEPLRGVLGRAERDRRVREVLALAHLEPELLRVLPRSLSGGQRQRVAIARALALAPAVLVCDEPVSALDVSIQAQILDLLAELNETTGTALVFISHDLGVVHHLVDDVLVMHRGRIVERGPVESVFEAPADPYTQALLRALPRLPKH